MDWFGAMEKRDGFGAGLKRGCDGRSPRSQPLSVGLGRGRGRRLCTGGLQAVCPVELAVRMSLHRGQISQVNYQTLRTGQLCSSAQPCLPTLALRSLLTLAVCLLVCLCVLCMQPLVHYLHSPKAMLPAMKCCASIAADGVPNLLTSALSSMRLHIQVHVSQA